MRIKKLELIGFKSFKDRTVIQFDAGITGIVGPNGCGKSNIVDALLWVMGEMSAKHLRGASMEDVIFAGAENYAPLGMSEVSLTLENDGGLFPARYASHSEVMVTRRLHRSGDSEYFINKEPARLKDIQEIFMDTGAGAKGFSIIAQGTIGQMITAKPEDRKNLIEEAAGITKFKARKKESQRKLVTTDQNLLRLQDITGELKRQIDSLQRQAERAERYRALKQKVEELDLWLLSKAYRECQMKRQALEQEFNECQGFELKGENDLTQLETELETLKLGLLEQEKRIESFQNLQSGLQQEISKKELYIQELRFEVETARRNEQMTGSLVEEQKARHQLLKEDEAEYLEEQARLNEELFQINEEFNQKDELFRAHESRMKQLEEAITNDRRELFALASSQSAAQAKIAALAQQVDSIKERLGQDQGVLLELEAKKQEFLKRKKQLSDLLESERQMAFDLTSDTEAFEVNKKSLEAQVDEKRAQVEEYKDLFNQTSSRLYGLENLQNNYEGFEEGVKQVMIWQKARTELEQTTDGWSHSQLKVMSEVLEVGADYERALEAALGLRLQVFLSQDVATTLEAAQYLKEKKSGRSSFLIQDENVALAAGGEQSAKPELDLRAEESGVVALLSQVVKSSQDEYSQMAKKLLAQIAVTENISDALRLRKKYPNWSFVTLEGDVVDRDGVLTAGGVDGQVESGVLKRQREIKELRQKKQEWAGKLELAQASLKKLEVQLSTIVGDFEAAQKRRQEQEIKLIELRKDIERAENELASCLAAIHRQESEVSRSTMSMISMQEKEEELTRHTEELAEKRLLLEEAIKNQEQEESTASQGFADLTARVTELKVMRGTKGGELEGVNRQLGQIQKSLQDLEAQLDRMSEEVSKNSHTMTEGQYKLEEQKIDLENLLASFEKTKSEYSQQKNNFEIELQKKRDLEEQVRSIQTERHLMRSRYTEAKLNLEQALMKEQYLTDQAREKYMAELSEVANLHLQRPGEVEEFEVELKSLREKLGKIGEVNLSAIEEYKETSQRYEFLVQQQSDLVQAKDQLRKVIERINKICHKRFKETFDLVNERFMRVFPVLFGGGEAKLELHENPENQEMGIEIIAKPPGKKMQNVTLMSGGEKALTAVALVFSIFLVKPSPYCLLDEVDAPLDDANVFRFNDLVREMSKRSQIIVVTHNKHTMEVAGKLYGVTMQERGVSTMVSVNLSDLGFTAGR